VCVRCFFEMRRGQEGARRDELVVEEGGFLYVRAGVDCHYGLNKMIFFTTLVKNAQRVACARGCAEDPTMWEDLTPLPFVGQIR